MCINCAECLEQVNPACILPVTACITGTTLAEQIVNIANSVCNVSEQLVTVNFGNSNCTPYQYEYTLLDGITNFTIHIDFYAFNDYVSDVKNITVLNGASVIASGSTTSFTLSKTLLLTGLTFSIQFILNNGAVFVYQDVITLNGLTALNKSYIKTMQCINNGIVTLPIQTVLQNILDRLNSCYQ